MKVRLFQTWNGSVSWNHEQLNQRRKLEVHDGLAYCSTFFQTQYCYSFQQKHCIDFLFLSYSYHIVLFQRKSASTHLPFRCFLTFQHLICLGGGGEQNSLYSAEDRNIDSSEAAKCRCIGIRCGGLWCLRHWGHLWRGDAVVGFLPLPDVIWAIAAKKCVKKRQLNRHTVV